MRTSATSALLSLQASIGSWVQWGAEAALQPHQHAGAACLAVHLSCEPAHIDGWGTANGAAIQLSQQHAGAAAAVLKHRDSGSASLCTRRCGHCKALKPAFEEVAARVAGKVRVAAVDCTENAATCQVAPQCRRMRTPALVSNQAWGVLHWTSAMDCSRVRIPARWPRGVHAAAHAPLPGQFRTPRVHPDKQVCWSVFCLVQAKGRQQVL